MSDVTLTGEPSAEATPVPEQTESSDLTANFSSQRVAIYQSPLPPAQELEALKNVDPDLPKQLMAMAEKEQRHKHATESRLIEINEKTIRENQRLFGRGQLLGFAIGIVTVAAGSITGTMGAQLAGGFIGTGGVVALAATFIYGSRQHPSSGKIGEPEPSQE